MTESEYVGALAMLTLGREEFETPQPLRTWRSFLKIVYRGQDKPELAKDAWENAEDAKRSQIQVSIRTVKTGTPQF